ncbi:hypothetical protein ACIF70_19285 [Actinacidiphila glaucinigra]|uniref:hypothetical protein n=1 Tax=Actinacidiphila glaucinigra TaxID=235986 RepID=UPI0037C955EC
MPETEIVTAGERPDLREQARAALWGGWPEFILHAPSSAEYRRRALAYFPRFDVLLLDGGEVVAGGAGVPLCWDGEVGTLPDGYDGAMAAAVTGHEASVVPDTLCVMVAAVRSDRLGCGLAGRVLTALRDRAVEAGLRRVIAPVRPTLKARYPLAAMEDFAGWARPDGLHLDPWIRTHQRLGATVLAPAPRSMVIPGTVAEWEAWAGMAFPRTGGYVVPGALDLVEIDRERDRGVYAESNLWMRHL